MQVRLPMRSLVVEDEFSCRSVLQAMLTPLGECHAAASAEEAVAAFEATVGTPTPYTLVCLDIGLPAADGLTVLRRIRALEVEHKLPVGRTKVIMTTGSGDRKDVMEAFRSGCEAYLVKPIRNAALLHELRKLRLVEEQLR